MLTDAQKDEVRRHSGFPVYGLGVGTTPPTFGYRYNTWYLILEYRMNNLSPNQELLLMNQYVANCSQALAAIQSSSNNLSTEKAAVWTHNKYEVRDRFQLYKLQCELLIQYMGLSSPGKLTGTGLTFAV